jgi:hypothetical protein
MRSASCRCRLRQQSVQHRAPAASAPSSTRPILAFGPIPYGPRRRTMCIMLHEFLSRNRDQLIFRCREKVASRPVPPPTELELRHGIPLFLDQLTEALRENALLRLHEAVHGAPATVAVRKDVGTTDIDSTAGAHGNELLLKGYTVDQVVHDYGDLCQAVTELALEQNAPITTDEFRTLSRCLDNAIADAVTAFERQRDEFMAEANTAAMNLRLGFLAHELRNLTTSAILAVAAIKRGNVGVAGATGAMLDRTLIRLRDLIDRGACGGPSHGRKSTASGTNRAL